MSKRSLDVAQQETVLRRVPAPGLLPTRHLFTPHHDVVLNHVHYGFHPTPFGECLIGITANTVNPAVCFLAFIEADQHAAALASLARIWANAILEESASQTANLARSAFSPPQRGSRQPHTVVRLVTRGTPFQIRVWRALLEIPFASTSTYSAIAHRIGAPHSARAVGTAVAANPIAWLIPCHRVLRADGTLGGYRWGEARKAAGLQWEARFAPQPSLQKR